VSESLASALFIFVLASFLGYAVITRVPGLLHTPLMSLTNALSAISIVGSLLLAGAGHRTFATVLGALAVFASTTNIVSGFVITDRMLKMFRRGGPARRPEDMAERGSGVGR
jgi:NAD(P) transhydrogenase subunit alpha